MSRFAEIAPPLTRRALLGRSALGLGAVALEALAARERPATGCHHAPRAKRVIWLFQNGGPSHVDLFDHKPRLAAMHGQQIPDSVVAGRRFSTMTGNQQARPCIGALAPIRQRGESGATVSTLLPYTAAIADRLCFVKSMQTTQVNHAPAIQFFLSGSERPGRPTLGAWLSYGLGRSSDELPTFVVMTSRDREASCGQIFYDFYWSSGFLPSVHQGVKFRGTGDPVLYLEDPAGIDRGLRRDMLDDLAALNRRHLERIGDPEIETRIAQYEMAYRMQASVPELTDLSDEPAHVLAMYGPDVHRKGSFAYNCLLARRLIERGTRYVQLMHAGWDQHRNLYTQLEVQCRDTDAPSAALVLDLAQRGLLDDTLVIWGGEFGRTPFLQGKLGGVDQGRDHHPYGFTTWLAGGGVRAGHSFGATDEFGFDVVADPVSPHDLQATILHLLGIDHERLTYRFQGRRYRLTDVHGNVVRGLLA
ncbi:MAG: DUF1501 domain-containing protein [Planctomycetes bacterium]|nr:DUF1501 domain-containing protein [Planctomycetota bacterium]